jgi:lipopolysaccharide transport system ATP-binding protein
VGTITVTNLGKAYKQYPNRWARLAEWLGLRSKPSYTLKWVLQNINFTVNPGEAVGIIGINGAGKSTLLKMITGISQATIGSVQITGRVAALLELGMGFHPDFTGRQNVFMAGQLLGMSIEEIHALMPHIEAFAEIGDYIEQPVRVYSSGMQMRLAFSVATARRPDVLIVDEALSVGDVYFQHKSFERIREFRKQGTTLLIVSHDKQAIQSICDWALLISAGQLAMQGAPEAVMDYYNALLASHQNQSVKQEVKENGKVQTISGTGEAVIVESVLMDAAQQPIKVVSVGQSVQLEVVVETREIVPELVLGYMIKDRFGQSVYGTNTYYLGQVLGNVAAGSRITYKFIFNANIGPGTYSMTLAVHGSESHIDKNYHWVDLAILFNVVNMKEITFAGTAWLPPKVEYFLS